MYAARCRIRYPLALLGRLAIDRGWQGSGLGAALLRDAVLRVVGAAGTIGVRALLVHAISDEAKAFMNIGAFGSSATDPVTLMITIDEATEDAWATETIRTTSTRTTKLRQGSR